MSKNRKTFIYVLQFDEDKNVTARIYRVKRNRPKFIGAAMYKCKEHLLHVQRFLRRNGHIIQGHKLGRDYFLKAV